MIHCCFGWLKLFIGFLNLIYDEVMKFTVHFLVRLGSNCLLFYEYVRKTMTTIIVIALSIIIDITQTILYQ